jgi:Concanavalin A-like lectin/glucanases superfamily
MNLGQNSKTLAKLQFVTKLWFNIAMMVVWLGLFLFSFRLTLPVLAATFVENTVGTFNGTFSNTQWNATLSGVRLTNAGRTAKTGTYTSQIKNAGSNSTWQTIGWVPAAPYGKELPDNGVSETVYSSGEANMANIEGLYHMNEGLATNISDTSGLNLNFNCTSSCPTVTTGKFNNGRNFASSSTQFATSATDLSTILGGTATVAYWIKTTQVGNNTFWQTPGIMGIEEDGAGNDIFYGILNASGRILFQVGNFGAVTSTNAINDGNWHHIAMSRVITTGTTKIYVDGTLNQTATLGAFSTITQPFFSLGRIENTNPGINPIYFNGALDEMAMYDRALSDTEVADLYKRGVQRILFQVRSCPTNTCSGISFKGPTSTTDFYSELGNPSNTLPVEILTGVSNNPFFQYRATLQVDDSAITPVLNSVTITYIAATPTLSFTIRRSDDNADINICDLGSASVVSVSTCTYRLKVSTNAASGYIVYVRTSGGLVNDSYTMVDAALGTAGTGGTDISNTTAGIESYGAVINQGSVTGIGNITLASRFNAGGTKAVSYNVATNSVLATATSANLPTSIDTTNTILITHRLNISNDTPAGYYTQTITYTASPSF